MKIHFTFNNKNFPLLSTSRIFSFFLLLILLFLSKDLAFSKRYQKFNIPDSQGSSKKSRNLDILDNRPLKVDNFVGKPVFNWNIVEKGLLNKKKCRSDYVLLSENEFMRLQSNHRSSALKLFKRQKQINESRILVKDAAWSITLINNQAFGTVSFNVSNPQNIKESVPLFSSDFSVVDSKLIIAEKNSLSSDYSLYIKKYKRRDYVFAYLNKSGNYILNIDFLLPVNINSIGGEVFLKAKRYINSTLKLTVKNPGVSVVFPEDIRPVNTKNVYKAMAEYDILFSNRESISFAYIRMENFEQISTPITRAEAKYALLKNKQNSDIKAGINNNSKKVKTNGSKFNEDKALKIDNEKSKFANKKRTKKIKPRIHAWVHSINDISQSRITSINVVKIKVDIIPVKSLVFRFNGDTDILKFECPEAHGFDIINDKESKRVVLTFQNSFKGTTLVGITSVSNFKDPKNIFPEKVIIEKAVSQTGFLGFCSSSNLSLEKNISENIQRIDPNELDRLMREKASAPIYFAFKYNSLPYRIGLRAKKFKSLDAGLSSKVAKSCYAVSKMDMQAGLVTELNIKIVNASSHNLKLSLLKNVEIMGIKVAEKSVAWSKEETVNNKNTFLIPLIRSEALLNSGDLKPFNTVIKYRVPKETFVINSKNEDKDADFFNQDFFNIDLILPDITIEKLNWTLKAPEKTEMIFSSSYIYDKPLPFFTRLFNGFYYTLNRIFRGENLKKQIYSLFLLFLFIYFSWFFMPLKKDEYNGLKFKRILSIIVSIIFIMLAFSTLPDILMPELYTRGFMDVAIYKPIESLIRPLDIYLEYIFEDSKNSLVQDKINIIKNMHFANDPIGLKIKIEPSWKFGLWRFVFFITGLCVLLLFKRICNNKNVLISLFLISTIFILIVIFSKIIKSADFYFTLGFCLTLIVLGFLKLSGIFRKYKRVKQGTATLFFLILILTVQISSVAADTANFDQELWDSMPEVKIDLIIPYKDNSLSLKNIDSTDKKILMKFQDFESLQWISEKYEDEFKRIEDQRESSMAVCLSSVLTLKEKADSIKENKDSMKAVFLQKILKTGLDPVKYKVADSLLTPVKIVSMPGISQKTDSGIYSNISAPGIYKSVISGIIPIKKDPATNRKSLEFNIPKCVSGKLNIFFPSQLIKPEIRGALNSISEYSKEGTSVTAYIVPSNKLKISWYNIFNKKAVESNIKSIDLPGLENRSIDNTNKQAPINKSISNLQKSRTLLTSDILCSINENFMKLSNIFNIQVNYSPVELFNFEVPKNINITSIDCPNMDKYKINLRDDRKILSVFLISPIQGNVRIVIEGEKIFEKLPETMIVPLIVLRNNGRNKITVSVASESNIRVKKITEKGLKPADIKSHSAMFEQSKNSKIIFSYTYASEKTFFKLALQKFTPLPMPATIINSANHNFLKRKDGNDLLESIFILKNNGAQFLKLMIPENYTIISAVVSENPVIPSKNSKGRILIPLVKSNFINGSFKSFPVKILSKIKSGNVSTSDIQVPLPDADCGVTNLKIFECDSHLLSKVVTDMNDFPISVKPIITNGYTIKNSAKDIGQRLDMMASRNLISRLFDNTMISKIRPAKINLIKKSREDRVFSQKYYSPLLTEQKSQTKILKLESFWMNRNILDILEMLLLYYGIIVCFFFTKLIKAKKFYMSGIIFSIIVAILFYLESLFPDIYQSFFAGICCYPFVFLIIKILSDCKAEKVKKVSILLFISLFFLFPFESSNAAEYTKIKNISSIKRFNSLSTCFSAKYEFKSLNEILKENRPFVLINKSKLQEMSRVIKSTFNRFEVQDSSFFESQEKEQIAFLSPASIQSCHLKGGFIDNTFIGEVQMLIYKHSPGPEYIKLTDLDSLPFFTICSTGSDIIKKSYKASEKSYFQRVTGRGLIKVTNTIMSELSIIKNRDNTEQKLSILLPDALINSFEISIFDNNLPKIDSGVITKVFKKQGAKIIKGYTRRGDLDLLWLKEAPSKTTTLFGSMKPTTNNPNEKKKNDKIVNKSRRVEKSIFLCDSSILYTFSENLLTGYAAVKLRIAEKSTDHVDLIIPKDTYITEIESSKLQFWEKVSTTMTRAVFRSPINGFVDLNIKFEKLFTPETKCLNIPIPAVFNAKRDGGFIALESSWDYFIETSVKKGVKDIPVQSIPEFMSAKAKRPFIGSYKYFSHPLDLKVNIQAIANMDKDLITAQADNVKIDFIPGDSNEFIAKVRMDIRNKTKQFLKLSLPENLQIVQYITNRKLSKPSWNDETKKEVLLPIEREAQRDGKKISSNIVSYTYKGRFSKVMDHLFLNEYNIPVPKMDIPCENLQINFHCPDEKVYSDIKNSDLRLKKPIAWLWPHMMLVNSFENSLFFNNSNDPISMITQLLFLLFFIIVLFIIRNLFLRLFSWGKRCMASSNKYMRIVLNFIKISFIAIIVVILLSPFMVRKYGGSVGQTFGKISGACQDEGFDSVVISEQNNVYQHQEDFDFESDKFLDEQEIRELKSQAPIKPGKKYKKSRFLKKEEYRKKAQNFKSISNFIPNSNFETIQQKVVLKSSKISKDGGISGILPVGMKLPGSRNIIRFYKRFLQADTVINPIIICTSENFELFFKIMLFISGLFLSFSMIFVFSNGIKLLPLITLISSIFYSFSCFKLFPASRPVLLYALLAGFILNFIIEIGVLLNQVKRKMFFLVSAFVLLTTVSNISYAFDKTEIKIPVIRPVIRGEEQNILLPLEQYRILKRSWSVAKKLDSKIFDEMGYISREFIGKADSNKIFLTYRGSFIKHDKASISAPLIAGNIHIKRISLDNEGAHISAMPAFPIKDDHNFNSGRLNTYYINLKDAGTYTFQIEMVLNMVKNSLKTCTKGFEIPVGPPIAYKIISGVEGLSIKAEYGINLQSEKGICLGVIDSGQNSFFFVKNRKPGKNEKNRKPIKNKKRGFSLQNSKSNPKDRAKIKKKNPRITMKCFEKYLFEDIYISGKIHLKIDVALAPLTELRFNSPVGWRLLNITSPGEIDYKIGKQIILYFNDGFLGIRDIYMDFEKSLSSLESIIELPFIRPEKIMKIDTFTGIVNNTLDLMNIENAKSKNIFNISPSSLPHEFSDLKRDISLAVQSKGFDRKLFIKKNSSGESRENTFACHETLYKTFLDSTLVEKTETTWWIANLSSPFLDITVPNGFSLISSLVDNKPVQPKIMDDKIMIPLIKSEKNSQGLKLFNVTIVCEKRHSDFSDFLLELPSCELFSPISSLTLILDNNIEMLKSSGHFIYKKMKGLSFKRSVYSKLNSRIITNSYEKSSVKKKNYLYRDQLIQAANLETNFTKLYDLKTSQRPGPLNIKVKPFNITGIHKENIYYFKGHGVVKNIKPRQNLVLLDSGKTSLFRFLLFLAGLAAALLLLTGMVHKKLGVFFLGLLMLISLCVIAVISPWLVKYVGGGLWGILILMITIFIVLLPRNIFDSLNAVQNFSEVKESNNKKADNNAKESNEKKENKETKDNNETGDINET